MRKVLCFWMIVVMTVGLGSLGCMDGLTRIPPPKGANVPFGATSRQSFTGGNVQVVLPDIVAIDAMEETEEDL